MTLFFPLFKKEGTDEIIGIGNAEIVQFTIFNRWGNIVFQTNDYQNDWNGKDKQGKELSEGVYSYVFI